METSPAKIRARSGTIFPLVLIIAFALLATLSACSPPAADSAANDSDVATPSILSFYNWDTYIEPSIIDNFERDYQVEIVYNVYDSDQDMLEELQAGGTTYDLVVPSDFIVSIMRQEELLAPLNKDNIPNFRNIA